MVTVELGQGAGPVDKYNLESPATVADLLDMAGVELGARKVKVDGVSADLDTELGNNSIVMLVQKVDGGK